MPLSALCCLGVMQISSGCLSRLNRDQNRQWSNRYKAGLRSAATEKTESAHTQTVKTYTEKCAHTLGCIKVYTFKYLGSHIYKDKKHRHSVIIHKHYSQNKMLQLYTNVVNPSALSKACGGDKTAGKCTQKTKE